MNLLRVSELKNNRCKQLLIDEPIDECIEKIDSLDVNFLTSIYITENSKVDDISFLHRFKNLKGIAISAKKIKNLELVNSFNDLSSLILDIKDKKRSIEALNAKEYDQFTLRFFGSEDYNSLKRVGLSSKYFGVLGKIESIDMIPVKCTKEMKLQNVSQLESISNISISKLSVVRSPIKFFDSSYIKTLHLESCNSLDLSSLDDLEGLASLTFRSIKEIAEWSFLKNKTLETILGSDVKKLSGLEDLEFGSQTKGFCINKLSNAFLKELSLSNPEIFLSNNSVSYYKNSELDFDYDLFERNI